MRRIFIGDVQGCGAELEHLLERAERELGDWEAWFVGDLVNRGPANLRVLERVRGLAEQGRAVCVLGNHELHLLATYWELREPGPFDTLQDVLASREAEDWVRWIRSLPCAVEGELGGQSYLLVHAAVPPDLERTSVLAGAEDVRRRLSDPDEERARAFLAADPAGDPQRAFLARLTSCRSVARSDAGSWSKEEPGPLAEPWHRAWQRRAHEYAVVYGHWATQGLHVAPGLRGLDTGCVHHGRGGSRSLTAWVPDPSRAQPFDLPDDRFWSAPAERAYYRDVVAERSTASTDREPTP